jgi:hypothetical protein
MSLSLLSSRLLAVSRRPYMYRVTIFLERKSGTRFKKQWSVQEMEWRGGEGETYLYAENWPWLFF